MTERETAATISRAKRFAKLAKERRELEARCDAVKSEMAVIEEALIEDFASQGVSNMSVDGMTIYLSSQVWAKARNGDIEALEAALAILGADWLVQKKINSNTLSGWARERIKNDETIPEEIETTEKFSVRARIKA